MYTIKKSQGFAPFGGSRGRVLSQLLQHLVAPTSLGLWLHPSSLRLRLHVDFPLCLSVSNLLSFLLQHLSLDLAPTQVIQK